MKYLSALLVCSIMVGCSSHKPHAVPPEFTEAQVEQMNRDALDKASIEIAKLIESTRSQKNSTQYLANDLFLKGNMSLLEGDYLTASVLFKHLVSIVPKDDFVQKKYAVSLIRINDLEGALKVLQGLYERSHDDKVGLILAGVYVSLDKESQARVVYQELIKKDPKNVDACVFLGKSYAVSKEVPKAIALLTNCSKNDPKNGMYDYYIGKILIDQGQVPKALEAFKLAHKKQPSLSSAVNALGVLLEEREQQDQAIALYKSHLEKQPNDATILGRMVQVLFLKESFKDVIPYAERLSDLDPDNLNLKVKLGILYTDVKRFPEAISVFKDLLGSAPQSDKILYYLGAIHQETNELQASIEYFNQIPATSGLYTDSSVQMANMLSTLATNEVVEGEGKTAWKEAFLKHVNGKIEELKDLRVEFTVIKAGYFEGVSAYKEAMEAMMVVQDEKGFSTQHKYYLANLFEKEKRYTDSTNLIMGIIEKEPKNAHAWNFLGYSVLVRGSQMDQAYEYIQKAYKISPEDGYIRDSLGWYYFKKGDMTRALSELNFALKKVPGDVEILKHLAIIHQELKQYGKAKNFYEEAMKASRYYSERRDIASSIESLEANRVPASKKVD